MCPKDHFCAHGFCWPRQGPTCLPPSTPQLWRDGQPRSVQGCEGQTEASCQQPNKPCYVGITRCVNGLWDNCDDLQPLPEFDKPCKLGKGQCEGEGKWRCKVNTQGYGKLWCDAQSKDAATETCDGLDNDCNGQVDDIAARDCYQGPPNTKGVGPCRAGRQRCEQGQWTTCAGEVRPQPESCDNQDNDCDGNIDEALTRPCYDGPSGTAGVGPCVAGTQRCLAGTWQRCRDQIAPNATQQCKPTLRLTTQNSLLACKASARSRSCDKENRCTDNGKATEEQKRANDDALVARCYVSHNKNCGVFASEGRIERQIAQPSQTKPLTLTLRGNTGSCACNGWCAGGCSTGAGCCKLCSISAQQCNAAASYIATHTIQWAKPLPRPYPIALRVTQREGSTIQLLLQTKGSNPRRDVIALKAKGACQLLLDNKGAELQLSASSDITCAKGDAFTFQLTLAATAPGSPLPPCIR